MSIKVRYALIAAAALLLSSPGSNGAEAAAAIFSQAPCVPKPSLQACREIKGSDTSSEIILRSFAYFAPSAGKAQITFHGSMACYTTAASGLISATTQIVEDAADQADRHKPGGNSVWSYLTPGNDFNLAATRVIQYTAGGVKRVHFKFQRHLIDAGVTCSLINLSFSVVFIP